MPRFTKIIFFLISFFISNQLFSQVLSTSNESLDEIFKSKKVKIRITNHGGFSTCMLDTNYLFINRKKDPLKYRIIYVDNLNSNRYVKILNKAEYKDLISVFYKMVPDHKVDKKLNGNCVDIDHNIKLSSKGKSILIYPEIYSKGYWAFFIWEDKI